MSILASNSPLDMGASPDSQIMSPFLISAVVSFVVGTLFILPSYFWSKWFIIGIGIGYIVSIILVVVWMFKGKPTSDKNKPPSQSSGLSATFTPRG
jgi:hypothetical protein